MLSTLYVYSLFSVLAYSVHCYEPTLREYQSLTKPISLRPGEVSNSFHKLPIPEGPLAVYSFAAEVVKEDRNGKIVPALLSEVYLHHHVVGSNFDSGVEWNGSGGHINIDITAKTSTGSGTFPKLSSPMKMAAIHRGVGFGAGTEARGTPQNFTHPFAFITSAKENHWIANVHIINTGPLTEKQAHRCLECPCTSEDTLNTTSHVINGIPFRELGVCNEQLVAESNTRCSDSTYYGGLLCCEDREFCLERSSLPEEPVTVFYLRYSIQYAPVAPDVRPLYLAGCCDATGDLMHAGAIEYDVPECKSTNNPDCVHSLKARQKLGGHNDIYGNEVEDREVDLVFAVGHQHRGGLGIQLFDDATGESICDSKPIYGEEEGVIGNEKGYVVAMTTCRFEPPLRKRLTDVLRVVSHYNSSVAHTGVMGLFYIAIADAIPGQGKLNLPEPSWRLPSGKENPALGFLFGWRILAVAAVAVLSGIVTIGVLLARSARRHAGYGALVSDDGAA
uniref:19-like isoform 1 n=1 Tax=Tetraselmis sp. GSL018 TaxID=582737 RepID=A0A061QX95_9CHLO